MIVFELSPEAEGADLHFDPDLLGKYIKRISSANISQNPQQSISSAGNIVLISTFVFELQARMGGHSGWIAFRCAESEVH